MHKQCSVSTPLARLSYCAHYPLQLLLPWNLFCDREITSSLGYNIINVWGPRRSGVFLVSLAAALQSSKVGATEAGVYIDYRNASGES